MGFPIVENLAGVSFQCLLDKNITPKYKFKALSRLVDSALSLHKIFQLLMGYHLLF